MEFRANGSAESREQSMTTRCCGLVVDWPSEALHANEAQSFLSAPRQVAKCAGDVGRPRDAQHTDREVAKGGHQLRPVAFAYLGAVLIEGDIAHPMEAVFHPPMAAHEAQQPLRRSGEGGEAGDAENDLPAGGAALGVGDDALEAKDLSAVGEARVVLECCAGPDAARLDAAVALVERFSLRGKKRRDPTGGCPRAGWVGCP